jgi:hypothetical protein
MKKLFEHFSGKTRFSQVLPFLDMAITFQSDQNELIELFTGPLTYLLPAGYHSPRRTVTCVIAQTTVLDNWPEAIKEKAKAVSTVNATSINGTTFFATEHGMTLITEGIGSLYHSGDGNFLCLIKPADRPLKIGETLNVLELATVLVSEVLLLTEKLLIHGGAVGINSKCHIWTGECGSGKTTQILSQVAKGWDFFGEDQIILGRGEDSGWRVWPFWRQIRVSEETSKLFPTRQDLSIRLPNNRKKYSFDNIEEVLQVKKPGAAELTSIIKLVPGNQRIMTQLDFTAAFRHLSEGFLHSLLPNSTTRVMDIFLDVIEETPIFMVSWDMLNEFEKRQFNPFRADHADSSPS